ncbi:crotonase/enoyl-CoA hydratase family protein [Gordonia hankookensis]|uniref:Crotonase/enoyl-CoA hydratase family protein n=1 Tax=Gordonia hankookensis TaxID=589403 RepID=A0ABR7WID7_9ACTN|nr:crotonase/enoyl-CoA hydratase family protein [Gordonia hankookensis]MBD1322336.1 crotonase/enoyl-CoA hydratase family protein [Gordonia hankookensis]
MVVRPSVVDVPTYLVYRDDHPRGYRKRREIPDSAERLRRIVGGVIIERANGPVRIIGINRPEVRNAVDRTTADALADAFRRFDADDSSSVAVLYGEGGTFCAGADLKAIADGAPNRIDDDGDGPMGPSRMRLSKPVIAAISGHAVAGGLELALWADLRVMDDDAVFGVFCRRWGVPLIDGGTVRLPRLIGASRAMDLILTGRPVSAPEALDIGLANRVVPAGTSLDAAIRLATEIAGLPQTCLRHDRMSMLEQEGLDERAAIANEFGHGKESLAADTLAGARRFAGGAGRHGAAEARSAPTDVAGTDRA